MSQKELFTFLYKGTENYPHEPVSNRIRHYGTMILPDMVLSDGTVIEGKLDGFIQEVSGGLVVPTFDKGEYTDFDFIEGLEYEYDDFIQETLADINERK